MIPIFFGGIPDARLIIPLYVHCLRMHGTHDQRKLGNAAGTSPFRRLD